MQIKADLKFLHGYFLRKEVLIFFSCLVVLLLAYIVIRKTYEVSFLMALPCHVVQLYGYPVVAHLCVGLSAGSASNCNPKTLHLSEPHPGKHLCGINQSIQNIFLL